MELAGVPTGAFMAAAEVDGSIAVRTRPFMRAVTRGPSSLRVLRAGAIGYSRSDAATSPAASLRAASRPRHLRAPAFLNGPNFIRSTSTDYSTDTASHRGRVRASEGTDNVPTGSTPKASPSFREKILAILRSDLFKLLMLGAALFIGCMAAKEHKIAIKVVEVCDKTHKVYNIASKAVVLAFFKGDE